MVAQVWILRKDGNQPVIDGIVGAVINSDSADPEATVIAEAVAQGVAGGHALPAGYFTTAENALAAGNMDTDEDAIFFGERSRTEVLA